MFPIAPPCAPRRGATLGAALLALTVLAVPGDTLARTEIVSPTGTNPVENCTALRTVIDGITDSAKGNPYLIKLEPGLYDCGANPIELPQFVELEGSGRTITVIAAANPGATAETAGAVHMNSYTALRNLTVVNKIAGPAQRAYAILAKRVNGARISDVTARVETRRGGHAQAIRFAGYGDLTVDRVHAVADSRARDTCAIFATVGGNRKGLLTLSNVVAEAADGDGNRIGLCARAAADRPLEVRVRDSVLAGPYGSVLDTGGHVAIAHSQLVGPLPPADTAAGREVLLKERDNIGPEEMDLYKPAVAPMPDGGFVVAWFSKTYSVDMQRVEVRAQRYNAAGEPFGAEFIHQEDLALASNSLSTGGPPISLAVLRNGDYMVVWSPEDDQGPDLDGIRVRRVDGVDTKISPELTFYDGTEGEGKHESNPVVAAMSDGGSVVAWCATYNNNANREIIARRFDGNGYSIWSNEPVAPTEIINPDEPNAAFQISSWHCAPAIAGLPNDEFVIAWETVGHALQPHKANITVFARRYGEVSPTELDPGVTVRVPEDWVGHQVAPKVAALSDGGYAVSWATNADWWRVHDTYGYSNDFDIAARRYPSAGLPGAEIAVDPDRTYSQTGTELKQRNNDVAGLADGGFAVVWQSAETSRIEGRLIDADGVPTGAVFRVSHNVPNETGTVTSGVGWPSAAALKNGGLVVVWEHQNSVWARVFADTAGPKCVHTYDHAYDPLGADCRPGAVATAAGPRM